MAIKMTDTANYSAIADAIRAKSGGSDTWTPAQMPAAIAAIPQGEKTPDPVQMNAHNFFDYDGTLLMSFSAAEVAEMTELPTPDVEHEGLIFDGWNWTLAEVQAAPFSMVGAHYRTDDGSTRLYFNIPLGNYRINFQLVNTDTSTPATVDIDWGDGSSSTVDFGTSSAADASHTYTKTGKVIVSLSLTRGGARITDPNIRFKKALYRVENGEVPIPVTLYNDFSCLQEIVTRSDDTGAFDLYNTCIKFVTLPRGCTGLSCNYGRFRTIAIPPVLSNMSTISVCYTAEVFALLIPATATTVPNITGSGVVISTSGDYAGVVISLPTTPPTLSSTSRLSSDRFRFFVPDTSVSAYKSATNWSSFSNHIYPISDLITELTGGAS